MLAGTAMYLAKQVTPVHLESNITNYGLQDKRCFQWRYTASCLHLFNLADVDVGVYPIAFVLRVPVNNYYGVCSVSPLAPSFNIRGHRRNRHTFIRMAFVVKLTHCFGYGVGVYDCSDVVLVGEYPYGRSHLVVILVHPCFAELLLVGG